MNVSSPHRRFRPRPEALEDRCCLSAASVSIVDYFRTLKITGTRSADRISVVGTADGKLMVTGNGGPTQTFSGIERISANTGDGRDQVSILIVGGRLADVSIDLGKGADSLSFRSGRAPQNGLFQGGDGKDIIDISYGGGGGGESSFNPQPEPPGRVALKILGGKSRDTINFALRGLFRDDLDATLDGGADADLVNALFAPAHDSTGHFRGRVVGGPANDRLTVNNARLDNSALFDLLIDGGRGTDRALVGPNAHVQAIEKPTQAGIWVQ